MEHSSVLLPWKIVRFDMGQIVKLKVVQEFCNYIYRLF